MLSMNQTITMGDLKRLEEMANSLLAVVQMAKTDLNEAIAENDEDLYAQHCVDIEDEVDDLWTSIGDWVADCNRNE